MPFKYEVNGQVIEFDKEPTETDIDEVAGQTQQQLPTTDIFTSAQLPEQQLQPSQITSPLTFGERFKYAFGNQQGRRNYLEQKFPDRKITQLKSGKLAVNGIPIDPEGFNIPDLAGDIVDVSDELVRLSGQIIGAAKGTLVSPIAGTIAGGVLGRAGGQIAVETIGRAFGMQQEEIGQLAKDIAMEGAIGGVGESAGLALRAISRPTVKFLRNFIQRMTQRFGRPFEQTLINFTSGAQRYNVQRLQERGVYNIMTKENLSDDALLKVGEQIQNAAIEARKGLGVAVETGKGLIREMNKANIDITDIRYDFGMALQKVGLLKRNFMPLKPQIGTKLDIGQKTLLNVWNIVKSKQKISPAQALQWRTELDRIIKFNQVGKIVITDAENALAQGLRGQLKQKLMEVSDEFAKANADFSAFAQIEEALKGKLNLQTIENFLKNLFTGQHFFERSLIELSKRSGVNFMPLVRDVVAARDFANATFKGIRTGIFSGLLGTLGLVGQGPGGAVAGATIGATLSTPRAAAWAIGKRQASVALLEKLLARGGQTALGISPKFIATLLSRSRQKK